MAGDGLQGRPLLVTINGKTRQYMGDTLQQQERWKKMKNDYGGPHLEFHFGRTFLDPKYPNPLNDINKLTREHAAYLEDFHMRMYDPLDSRLFKTVGFFKQGYLD